MSWGTVATTVVPVLVIVGMAYQQLLSTVSDVAEIKDTTAKATTTLATISTTLTTYDRRLKSVEAVTANGVPPREVIEAIIELRTEVGYLTREVQDLKDLIRQDKAPL